MKRLTEKDVLAMHWLTLKEKQDLLFADYQRGVVYVIGSEAHPYCKIGVTRVGAKKRLNEFQVGSPFKLHIVKEIHSSHCEQLEEILHEQFESNRIRGEWFQLSPNDINELDEYDY